MAEYAVEAQYEEVKRFVGPAHDPEGWLILVVGSRSYCYGYLDARLEVTKPRPAHRVRVIDGPHKGKVVRTEPAIESVSIGMVAGYPSVDQLMRAATGVLQQIARGPWGRVPPPEAQAAAAAALEALVHLESAGKANS